MTITRTIEMVTVKGNHYYTNGTIEEVEYTTYAKDKIGVGNFIMYACDEVVKIEKFEKTETKEVNFIQYLKYKIKRA